jgi:hypothetical protein
MTTTAFERLTDSDGMPTLRRFMAYKLGRMLDNKSSQARNRARTQIQNYVRVLLHLIGFACLTIAGFSWNSIAGFVVAGLSCFTISLLTTGGQSEPTGHTGLTTR